MRNKELLLKEDVRKKMVEGVNLIADAVGSTLGPYGRNVAIARELNEPHITKDGVTVANNISFKDPYLKTVTDILKEGSRKTALDAGDGTTSTTVMARELFELGLKFEENNPKGNIMEFKRGMENANLEFQEWVDMIKEKILVEDPKLKDVIKVSSNNDEEIINTVSDIIRVIGEEGFVSLKETADGKTSFDTVDGFMIERNNLVPVLVKSQNGETILENKEAEGSVKILITDEELEDYTKFSQIVYWCKNNSHPLLIMCDDIKGDAVEYLSRAVHEWGMDIGVIRLPGFADARKNETDDIALITGATVVSTKRNNKWQDFSSSWLGDAKKVEIKDVATYVIGRKGDPDKMKDRIDWYKKNISETSDSINVERLQKRLSRFTSGVAVVKVGGNNIIEIAEKKDRYDDSVRAAKAALSDGVVTGGGYTYALYKESILKFFGEGDFNKGREAFVTALDSIIKKIRSNGGITDEKIDAEFIKSYGDEMKLNLIYDPAKVVKSTTTNAVSVAGLMLTTSCIIGYNTEDNIL